LPGSLLTSPFSSAMSKPDRNFQKRRRRNNLPAGTTSSRKAAAASLMLLWGVHPILEVLKARPRQLKEIFVARPKTAPKLQEIVTLARQHRITINSAPEAFAGLLQKRAAEQIVHQGVLALSEPFPFLKLNNLIARLKTEPASSPPVLLALDSIQDPQNVGTVMRSALAAGVAGIIIVKDRAAPLTGAVAKASAGAIALLQICQVTNLPTALQQLKKEGLWVFGTAGDADRSLYNADFSIPACLVMGSEEKGLRPLVRKQCDFLISIPMQGGLDSLNVSTAAAVVLFEIARQRLKVSSSAS
jgi:23S rRNA (guanosine2251-2'-O)-methyltransferase